MRVKREKMWFRLRWNVQGKAIRKREIERKKDEEGRVQSDTLYFDLILLKADRISLFHSSRGQCVCVPLSISLPFIFSLFLSFSSLSPFSIRFYKMRATWLRERQSLFPRSSFVFFFPSPKKLRIETRSFVRSLTINGALNGDVYSPRRIPPSNLSFSLCL